MTHQSSKDYGNPVKIMATAWRNTLRFCKQWPLHHPHRCNYLPLIILAFLLVEVEGRVSSKGCLERERDSLLLFKAAIEDPSGRLYSWRVQVDCCAWTGVVCHNSTGSVLVAELNLQNPNAHQLNERETALKGELLHQTLSSLTRLHTLNLSFNDFERTQIPPLLGSLRKLRHLDLSWSNFSGAIPPHLGNLTDLRYLDLKSYYFPGVSHSLDWLSRLSSLIYLDMSFLNLSAASHNLASAINMLPSLRQLNLYDCRINNIPLSSNLHFNLTSLVALDLRFNDFYSSFPNWLWNLTSLSSLLLENSKIPGTLPAEIGNLVGLTHLDLSFNFISGSLPVTICKLKHLANLDLSFNSLGNSFPIGIMNLSSLSTVSLDNCSLVGPIPSELGNLTTLKSISLRTNSLSGSIPVEIGKLVDLHFLDLSANSFEGNISQFHFSNLTKLKTLFLSGNSFLTIAIDQTWTPPFQLQDINFDSCKLGPKFPAWLYSQRSIMSIQLYDTSIEDTLAKQFWNSSSIITTLDLSHNKINGTLPASLESLTKLYHLNLGSNLFEGQIPHFPLSLHFLDLSVNAFVGPIPPTLFTPHLYLLLLSHNYINGSIPSDICNFHTLRRLNLSNNQISGEIPRCWQRDQYLNYIHLGNNMLSGEIPNSLGNLMGLKFLHLSNNNLNGRLPSSLQNCTELLVIDLCENKFSGNIPLWIGQSWQQLRILRLCSNMFIGNIDPQLGHLRDLQIIDLANNKLFGQIPPSFGNFSAMISTSARPLPIIFGTKFFSDLNFGGSESITLTTKGDQLTFSSILYLVKSIDLSNNGLTDEIPKELGYLAGLQNLNLSRNYFRGKIPDSFRRMNSLETLDLSFNNLSGAIPQGLSELSALSHLNFSHNNLSGNIPFGNQLQTLDDATIYSGNPHLCGELINKSCSQINNINVTSEEHVMLSQLLSIYLSSVLGYLVGLWSVFILLLFKKKWRAYYFKKVDEIFDNVYVRIKIRFNRIYSECFKFFL